MSLMDSLNSAVQLSSSITVVPLRNSSVETSTDSTNSQGSFSHGVPIQVNLSTTVIHPKLVLVSSMAWTSRSQYHSGTLRFHDSPLSSENAVQDRDSSSMVSPFMVAVHSRWYSAFKSRLVRFQCISKSPAGRYSGSSVQEPDSWAYRVRLPEGVVSWQGAPSVV